MITAMRSQEKRRNTGSPTSPQRRNVFDCSAVTFGYSHGRFLKRRNKHPPNDNRIAGYAPFEKTRVLQYLTGSFQHLLSDLDQNAGLSVGIINRVAVRSQVHNCRNWVSASGLAVRAILGQCMHQFGGAGEASFGVVPVAMEDLLVGAEFQGAGIALDQVDEAGGIGERLSRSEMTAPLGPVPSFSVLASRQSRSIAISSRFSTSAGNGSKRSISSATKPSISRRSESRAMRR
jgi:hypothetical protein